MQNNRNYLPYSCVTYEQLLTLLNVPGGHHHHHLVCLKYVGHVGKAAGVGHGTQGKDGPALTSKYHNHQKTKKNHNLLYVFQCHR